MGLILSGIVIAAQHDELSDGIERTDSMGCCLRAEHTVSPTPQAPADFRWGLVAYHVAFPSYDLRPEDFALIAANGIGWLSVDFAWAKIEPIQNGGYDFSYFDMIVAEAERHGIEVMAKLGSGYNGNRPIAPAWTRTLEPGAYISELKDYTEATVSRYRDHIKSWSLENELNIPNVHTVIGWRNGIWLPSHIDQIMVTLSETVRALDPTAEIVISVTPLTNYERSIERMSQLIDYDTVGVHTYPAGFIPEPGLAKNVIGQIERAQQASGGREVIILETGFHTEGGDWNVHAQAEYIEAMTRATIRAGAKGIFFYQLLDSPEETGRERFFGLLTAEREPKPGWYRYGSVIENHRAREALTWN
ncbi:MAG: beta-galactosidase [Pseudomonadota bacterium]|nr:beta-galactosidase [Pseudomonadota bacterium]